MEMCLGDQQFVTLLLYLDDICIFVASINEVLDIIWMMFKRLKEFNLKAKPKNLGYMLSTVGISANPEKVNKVKNWPVPTRQKEVHFFLGLTSCHWYLFLIQLQ